MIEERIFEPLYALDDLYPFPVWWELTKWEKETARLIGTGLDSQGIGDILKLSRVSINNRLSKIYDKSGSTKIELAVWCAHKSRVNTIRVIKEYNPMMYDFITDEERTPIVLSQLEMDMMESNAAGMEYRDIGNALGATRTMVSTTMLRIREKIDFRPDQTAQAILFILAKDIFTVEDEPVASHLARPIPRCHLAAAQMAMG
jgi:DNA-binding CsgD family transcriptional regulator